MHTHARECTGMHTPTHMHTYTRVYTDTDTRTHVRTHSYTHTTGSPLRLGSWMPADLVLQLVNPGFGATPRRPSGSEP